MAIFRVNKNKDYTVMSNYHLRDKNMSFKAKGLLSMMLSLPDDWDYSIKGIASISKENEKAIKTILDELKELGYLRIVKLMPNETKSGRIEYIYDIYEMSVYKKQEYQKQGVEFQEVEKQEVEKQEVEKVGQINTNIQNTKKQNTKKQNTDIKREYGEFKNVLLTDDDYKKLEEKNALSQIENLSSYMSSTGKRYKDHYATILNWERRDKQKQEEDKYKGMSYREQEYIRQKKLIWGDDYNG